MYLALPSSASKDIYPENSPSHYSVQLKTPLIISRPCEIGLCEISYPNTIDNVGPFTIHRKKEGEDIRTFDVKGGYFKDIKTLLNYIRVRHGIRFKYNEQLNRVTYFCDIDEDIYMTKAGTEIHEEKWDLTLGFDNRKNYWKHDETKKIIFAGCPPAFDRVINTMYVYTDLIKDTIVGDIEAKLLRTVPIIGEYNQYVTQEFENIYYHPIEKQFINSIEIDIRDDTGAKIDFRDTEVHLVFHLRWLST